MAAPDRVVLDVLGVAQDAGVPHIGCDCVVCETAREDSSGIRYATAAILRVGPSPSDRYLIDATPDIRFQLDATDVTELRGVILTHVHLGHVGGLSHFGTEALDADSLSVFCTPSVATYLESNGPYRTLVDRDQIDIHRRPPGEPFALTTSSVSVEPLQVPHRGETDTIAIRIDGPHRTLLYLSDLDAWTEETLAAVREVDVALVDGTFWRKDELDRIDAVPHPAIVESMDRLEGTTTDIRFIHLNHTNPALQTDSPERRELEDRGFAVADRNSTIEL